MTKNPWLVPQADKMTDNAFRLKEELIEANSMSQQDKVVRQSVQGSQKVKAVSDRKAVSPRYPDR